MKMLGNALEMHRRPSIFVGVTCALLVAVLVGCAGVQISRITGTTALPKDLPKEIQEKFEVREVTVAPSTTPSPQPSPGVGGIVAATKATKKAKPVAKPAPPPKGAKREFVYPSRRPEKDPIWVGEKATYEVSYFGMAAGDFVLEVLPYKMVANRKVYHVRGVATTSQVFSLFYRLNDMVETFIDFEGIFSHRFHIQLDESKQTRDATELYDSERQQTFYWNQWQKKDQPFVETKEFFQIPPFVQDSLSALFYVRTRDLKDGAVLTFPIVSEGKAWDAEVTVVRRETLQTPMGRIPVVVVKPETKYQGVLQKRGDSFLWLTDDDRKFLVRLEAKVKVGTVVANLKEFEPGTSPAQAQ